jgi:hypothetical protein
MESSHKEAASDNALSAAPIAQVDQETVYLLCTLSLMPCWLVKCPNFRNLSAGKTMQRFIQWSLSEHFEVDSSQSVQLSWALVRTKSSASHHQGLGVTVRQPG